MPDIIDGDVDLFTATYECEELPFSIAIVVAEWHELAVFEDTRDLAGVQIGDAGVSDFFAE